MKKLILISITNLVFFTACYQQANRNSHHIETLPNPEKAWAVQLSDWYSGWNVPSYKRAPIKSNFLNEKQNIKSNFPSNKIKSPLLIEPNIKFSKPKLKKE